MGTDTPKKNKSSLFRWMIVAVMVVVFVGARQLHPGGIRRLIGDFITESSSNPEVKEFRDKILDSLVPVGAAAICSKEHGENKELSDAA
jgi:hypothetical protein